MINKNNECNCTKIVDTKTNFLYPCELRWVFAPFAPPPPPKDGVKLVPRGKSKIEDNMAFYAKRTYLQPSGHDTRCRLYQLANTIWERGLGSPRCSIVATGLLRIIMFADKKGCRMPMFAAGNIYRSRQNKYR